MRLLLPIACLALFACHDAQRENPFDPVLTPAPVLQVALDDTLGTATLPWSPYDSETVFAAYLVLRQAEGLEKIDTLAAIATADCTRFVDATISPDTSYAYQLATLNAAGFQTTSDRHSIPPVRLPAVALDSLDFDSAEASATMSWSRYAGARFGNYRVVRRTAQTAETVVDSSSDIGHLSFSDGDLRGDTEYVYRVDVVTDRSEVIFGPEMSGGIHRFEAGWSLPMSQLGKHSRLNWEDGALVGAVAGQFSGHLLRWTRDGDVLEDNPIVTGLGMATDVSAAGQRQASLITGEGGVGLFSSDGTGELASARHVLTSSAAVGEAAHRVVDGVVFLEPFANYDNLKAGGANATSVEYPEEDWTYVNEPVLIDQILTRGASVRAFVADSTWLDPQLTVEGSIRSTLATDGRPRMTIGIGGELHSRFRLTLDAESQAAYLDWEYNPPDGSEGQQTRVATRELPVIDQVPYQLSIGVTEGQVTAQIDAPVWWVDHPSREPTITSLAALGDGHAFSVDDRSYFIDGGTIRPGPELPGPVSEIRTWRASQGTRIGICLPVQNRILIGLVLDGEEVNWANQPSSNLGPYTFRAGNFLSPPISFDVGPDGRIYVLDPVNVRVLVFDRSRRYVTEWDAPGDGPGEFNFGIGSLEGELYQGFSGSIAVDDEGFIYVADVGNQRIQKFSP